MADWLNPQGPIYKGPDPLNLGGEGSIGNVTADIVTGDDPNDDIDLGQKVNQVIPGTPLAAADEFGGPKEEEPWAEDSTDPWDVTQEESENTLGEWTDNVSQDVAGMDFGKLRILLIAGAFLYLLGPVLQIGANVTE